MNLVDRDSLWIVHINALMRFIPMKFIIFMLGLWALSSHSSMAFTLNSSALDENQAIPALYTCHGENISPALMWKNPPAETPSYVLIMNDPDTKPYLGVEMTHWVLFDVPADVFSFSTQTNVGISGTNGKSRVQYDVPCPPKGAGVHHYVFTLYALNLSTLGLDKGASLDDVMQAIQGHVIQKTQLVGTFENTNGR